MLTESRKPKADSCSPRHGVFADDHDPFLDAPLGDESLGHVRIVLHESLDLGLVVGVKDEQRAGRLEGSGEHQAVVGMGRVDHRQMRLAVRQPALDEVVHGVVKESEVRHRGRMPQEAMVIARTWSGVARPETIDAYLAHLRDKTLPAIEGLEGHRGAYVLRRGAGEEVLVTVITLWESVDAIR